LISELGRAPVHGDATGCDPTLDRPTRAETGVGECLLNAFRHASDPAWRG